MPVLLHIIVGVGFATMALFTNVLLGRAGKRNADKDMVYECGMVPETAGQPRFSVKFYLVAMLFILFDIEVVFMYPWAVQFRDLVAQGPAALVSLAGFAGILVIAYAYALKKGALNWKS